MQKVTLTGLAKTQGERVKAIKCAVSFEPDARGVLCNLSLAGSTVLAIEAVLEAIKHDCRRLGIDYLFDEHAVRLDIPDPQGIEYLQDASFALPIHAALMAECFGSQVREDILGTGRVTAEGWLDSVQGANRKGLEADEHGFKVFLYPAKDYYSGSNGVPVGSALAASVAWLPDEEIEKILLSISNRASAKLFLEAYMESHSSSNLVPSLGNRITNVYHKNVPLQEAYVECYGEILYAIAKEISTIPIAEYGLLLNLMHPKVPYRDFLEKPDYQQKFILKALCAMKQHLEKHPLGTTRALLNIFRILARDISVTEYLRQQKVLDLLHEYLSYAETFVDEYPVVKTELRGFGRYISLVNNAMDHTLTASQRTEKPLLQIEVRYQESKLSALAFSFPDHKEIPESVLANPVALWDMSSSLPKAWQKSHWKPEDSAVERLMYGRDIANRFGQSNIFKFPRLWQNGYEVVIKWGDGTGTWPPSIDSLHLVSLLAEKGFYGANRRYKSLLDLGCGTGVHGILFAKNSNVQDLFFLDAEPSARITSALNVIQNFEAANPEALELALHSETPYPCTECSVQFLNGYAQSLVERDDLWFDLVICTPPYVPFVNEFRDPSMWQAVAGTEVIRFVFENWKKFADRVVIQFSDIALSEIGELPREASILGSSVVAFKIPPLAKYFDYRNPDLLTRGQHWFERVSDYLIDVDESGGIPGLVDDHGFRFFHRVTTYLLE